jgi:uncharacterized SAM-binding protein YcdF (DUF218 family)
MKYLGPLVIKFLMTTAVLWIVLGLFFGVTFGDIIMTSIILTVVASLGDLFILPRIGNTSASIADFALTWAIVWMVGSNMYGDGIAIGTAGFVSAIAITVGEVFFHRYLKNLVFKDEKYKESKVAYFPTNYQTELGSDNGDVRPKDEK